MSIKIKTDLEWWGYWRIKNDPEGLKRSLVGIQVRPPNQFLFILDYLGDEVIVYDGQCEPWTDEMEQEWQAGYKDSDDDD